MRNLAMARAAVQALVAPLAIAAMLAILIFPLALNSRANAQDLFAPPMGEGEDRGYNDGPPMDDGGDRGYADGPGMMEPGASRGDTSEPMQVSNDDDEPTSFLAPPEETAAKPAPNTVRGRDEPSSSASGSGTAPAVKVATRPTENDIYDQWSAKKLKKGRSYFTRAPHALSMEYPDHFVVVCEAGCKGEDAQIVYMEERSVRGPVYKTPDQNTLAETDYVACVGGCYKSGLNTPLYQVRALGMATTAGSWMTTTTTVKSEAEPPETGGRWYNRMDDKTQKKAEAGEKAE